MNSQDRKYAEASLETAASLRAVAKSKQVTQLSPLTLPEINAVVDVISETLPAGNVPSIILSNLVNSPGRRPPPETAKRDVNLLYQGLSQTFARAKHGAQFAGPAAVLWGYQNLLKLAGKETETTFPEGLWQFYVDFAFREDTSRYTIETHAFDTVLRRHDLTLSPVKRITAWVMAAVQMLHQYDTILTNRWREQVYLSLLQQVSRGGADEVYTADLHRVWHQQTPFSRGHDAEANQSYTMYRRAKFDQFLRGVLAQVNEHTRYAWNQQVQIAKEQLPAYLRQLSILAYLEPTQFSEERQPLTLQDTCVGLIYQNRYYSLPICHPGSTRPIDATTIEAQIAEILAQPTGTAALHLSTLTQLKRTEWAALRPTLNGTLLESLQTLRHAPILFNADQQMSTTALSDLRQAERGVGDHPLTIFDVQRTAVFDASHILFDARDAAEFAEILTQEALAWGVYLSQTQQPTPPVPMSRPLMLPFERSEQIFIQQADKITAELTAETTLIQVKPIIALQKMFRMRSSQLNLGLRDLLLLYRAIHHFTYQPDPALVSTLDTLHNDRKLHEIAEAVRGLWTRPQSPGLLIPLTAYQAPHERIYPMLFSVPLQELNLLHLHQETLSALIAYETADPHDRLHTYTIFDKLQREYLATLAGFGQVLTVATELAQSGENRGQEVVRMVANLPTSMKKLFDQMSNRSEILNNVLKGSEVFEWLDVSGSTNSISRFMAGKEDSDQKTLVWSGLLDNRENLILTLRDFRPEMVALVAGGRPQLAKQLSNDYLTSYARGVNAFIGILRRITKSSRETQIMPPPSA